MCKTILRVENDKPTIPKDTIGISSSIELLHYLPDKWLMLWIFGGIPMVAKKDKRHSGYVTPKATVSKKDLIENDLFINDFYDDWEDHRDGLRDWFRDFKKIKKPCRRLMIFNEELYEKRVRMNLKQKKLLKRRKAKKAKNS